MHPGKRSSRAVFSAPPDERDEIGNPSRDLVEIGRAWVSLVPVTAREYMYAGGERALVTHKLTMARPAFEIPQNAIATVAGRVFDVQAALDAPSSAEITLMCVEKRS